MDVRGDVINWAGIRRHVFPLGTKGADGPLAVIAGRYAGWLPLVGALGLVSSVLESVGIGLLIPLVALLLAEGVPQGLPGPILALFAMTQGLSPQARIATIGAGILLAIAIKGLVQTANATLIAWINGSIGRDVRAALSLRILNLDYSFCLENEPARLVEIISTDSWFVSDAVRASLSIVPAVLALVVFGGFLAWLDWRLFAIVLVGTAIIRGGLLLLERRLRRLSFEVTQSNYALGERMLGIVSAMRVIRVFGQQEREQARFTRSADRVRRAMFASQRTAAWLAPSVDVLTFALFVAILLAGYRWGTSLPEITAFVVLLSRAQPNARTIGEARLQIAGVRGSVEAVEWLLGQPLRPVTGRSAVAPVGEGPIRFEHVSYAYPGGAAAVRGASFEIHPGRATALIGPSGSGKSTLVNLLCGLIEPQSGTITVGEVPLDSIDPERWRERIAIAGQDIELVEGTVAENIAYGRPDASQAEIEEAALTAGADSFVAGLPEGYASRVGQGGLRLSGGQRQRIGIARALLRAPQLLILDEATNAVDTISEQELMKLLSEHRHFRAALVISHRRTTVAGCQDGIVVDHGEISESGPLRTLAYYQAMAGDPQWT
jgi:subfamily B ATP-binding cassette protein MsbA